MLFTRLKKIYSQTKITLSKKNNKFLILSQSKLTKYYINWIRKFYEQFKTKVNQSIIWIKRINEHFKNQHNRKMISLLHWSVKDKIFFYGCILATILCASIVSVAWWYFELWPNLTLKWKYKIPNNLINLNNLKVNYKFSNSRTNSRTNSWHKCRNIYYNYQNANMSLRQLNNSLARKQELNSFVRKQELLQGFNKSENTASTKQESRITYANPKQVFLSVRKGKRFSN